MKLTAICATLVATCSLALTSASYGQEIKPHTLRFAHQNSAQHPQGQGVLKFIELVKQKSGGKIDVRDFPGGTLKKAGMQVNDIAAAELARIREKVEPVVDKYSAQIGEPWVKDMNAELAKMRGK